MQSFSQQKPNQLSFIIYCIRYRLKIAQPCAFYTFNVSRDSQAKRQKVLFIVVYIRHIFYQKYQTHQMLIYIFISKKKMLIFFLYLQCSFFFGIFFVTPYSTILGQSRPKFYVCKYAFKIENAQERLKKFLKFRDEK